MVRFLRDAPADEDFFKTHSSIARAIVQAISDDDQIRVVGLLGSWGSGKSTVIKQVAKCLSEDDKLKNYLLFEYDTWLNQSDPPRRSFIEALVGYLIGFGCLDEKSWNKRLKTLKGENQETVTTTTPILTWKSVVLLKTYAALGVGLFLLNKASLDKLDSTQGTELNVLLFATGLLLVLLAPLAMAAIYTREKFVEKLKPEERSVVPRLLNKEIVATRTATARQPDPTSIEFRDAFRDIVSEVGLSGKRLILVLDNIDRLSDDDALMQWSTLRGFFVDRLGQGFAETNGPVVVVPVALSSITRIFSHDKSGKPDGEVAQSYLDKTFDVVFSVRDPALSDWRQFFDQCLQATVGDKYTSRQIHDARRLYEAFLAGENQSTTPRAIVRLANRVAALVLEIPVGIPLPTLCLYALHKRAIDSNIATFVTGPRDYSNFDPDWKLNLASAHFLVERKKAVGPLIKDELTKAIADGQMAKVLSFSEFEGVGDLLADIVHQPPVDDRGLVALNTVALIAEVLEKHGDSIHGSAHWREECEAGLVTAFASLSDGAQDLLRLPSTLKYVAALAADGEAQSLIEAAASLTAHGLAQPTVTPPTFDSLAQTLDQIAQLAEARSLDRPKVELPTDVTRALSRQYGIYTRSSHWRMLAGPTDEAEIAAALSAMLDDPLRRPLVPDLLAMLRHSPEQRLVLAADTEDGKGEATLIGKISDIVRDGTQSAALEPAIGAMAILMVDNQNLQEIAKAWSSDGVLSSRLQEAVASENDAQIAALLALGVGTEIYFPVPESIAWPANVSTAAGSEAILEKLQHWGAGATRVKIWNAIKNWANTKRPLLSVRDLFISKVKPTDLDPAQLLQNANLTINQVGGSAFFHLISRHPKFEEALANASADNLLDILQVQGISKAPRDAVHRALRNLAANASEETWSKWLDEGSRIFELLTTLAAIEPFNFSKRSQAGSALEKKAKEASRNRPLLKRWISLLKQANRRAADHALVTLLDEMMLRTDYSKAIGDMKMLGDVERLLVEVRSDWSPFLIGIMEHEDGREWINQNTGGVRNAMGLLSQQHRSSIKDSVKRLSKHKREGRRRWAERALVDLCE